MNSKKVVIIGGEGNGGVIASCIEDNRNRFNDKEWEVAGFLNDFETQVDGFPVIGQLTDLPRLLAETDYYFIWAIHLVARNYKTSEMFEDANIPENRLATIVHKSAFIGKGATLCPGAFVQNDWFWTLHHHVQRVGALPEQINSSNFRFQ